MLIFTNRHLDAGTSEKAFSGAFTRAGEQLAVAEVGRAARGWKLSDIDGDVDEVDALVGDTRQHLEVVCEVHHPDFVIAAAHQAPLTHSRSAGQPLVASAPPIDEHKPPPPAHRAASGHRRDRARHRSVADATRRMTAVAGTSRPCASNGEGLVRHEAFFQDCQPLL